MLFGFPIICRLVWLIWMNLNLSTEGFISRIRFEGSLYIIKWQNSPAACKLFFLYSTWIVYP
jgi:hypothetical protein